MALIGMTIGGHDRAADRISAPIDSLPSSGPIWSLVVLLSLGSFCEIYDLGLTAYLAPALTKAGIFKARGLFGMNDAATFIAVTFAGFWVGTLLSRVGDRYGRVPAQRYSLIFYSLMSGLAGCSPGRSVSTSSGF